jgi:hypothetical protein
VVEVAVCCGCEVWTVKEDERRKTLPVRSFETYKIVESGRNTE